MANDNVVIQFTNPNRENFRRNILYASATKYPCVKADSLKGKNAVIVGSGPSLNKKAVKKRLKELYKDKNNVFFGCKAAIQWLHLHHMTPTYGVSMDPGAHIACEQKLYKAPGVTHVMASVTAPEVFEYLDGEKVQIFHSVCGLDEEVELYRTMFDDGTFVQGGYNVINRAMALAIHMGADVLYMAGCDSGWREDQTVYVDGNTFFADQKKVFMNDNGMIDGKTWHSTPDMVASAVALAGYGKQLDKEGKGDKLVFIGDVLPAALRAKPEEFLKEVAEAK